MTNFNRPPLGFGDDDREKDLIAQMLRQAVIDSGANASIFVSDMWLSPRGDDDVRPRDDPQRQEVLHVSVELRGVGQWLFHQTYSRAGQLVLIAEEPPQLKYGEMIGRFFGLFEGQPFP